MKKTPESKTLTPFKYLIRKKKKNTGRREIILEMYHTKVLLGRHNQCLASNRPTEKLVPLAKLVGNTW